MSAARVRLAPDEVHDLDVIANTLGLSNADTLRYCIRFTRDELVANRRPWEIVLRPKEALVGAAEISFWRRFIKILFLAI